MIIHILAVYFAHLGKNREENFCIAWYFIMKITVHLQCIGRLIIERLIQTFLKLFLFFGGWGKLEGTSVSLHFENSDISGWLFS
jgi:hypothetical protein